MNRRDVLCGAGALAAGLALPWPAAAGEDLPDPRREDARLDALVHLIDPRLDLVNAHTGERLRAAFFGGTGYSRPAIETANWFMRDWRQKEGRQMDVRLYWALAALRQAAQAEGHDGQIVFLSGYRTRATNDLLRRQGIGAARNSFHLRARAVDFVIPGVPVATVAGYAEWLQVGGTGHYPGNFVHIDTGGARTWIG